MDESSRTLEEVEVLNVAEEGRDKPEEATAPEEAADSPSGEVEVPSQEEAPAPDEAVEESSAAIAGEDSGEHADEAPEDEAGSDEDAPGRHLSNEELRRRVCALVFASPDPLSIRRLVQLLEGPEPARVREAIREIDLDLETAGLPLELREIAGGWRLMTQPEMAPLVQSLVKERKAEKLSGAALETLSVVAYRQPVTKAEIEAIRGVQCGAMLRSLVDRGLAKVVGRADLPGHPLQYGTSREFLDRFGLGSLKDLPRDGELLGE